MCLALFPSACIPPSAGGGSGRPVGAAASSAINTPRLEADLAALRGEDAPPVWEVRQVSRNAVSVTGGSYTVQSGDTLRSIGNRTGAGSEALALANGLEAPYTIYAGQRLTVPSGLFHSVSSGETGIAIARAYDVRWSDIVALNNLEEPFILRIGQRLMLPERTQVQRVASTGTDTNTSTAPTSLEQRAAAFSLGIDDIVTGGQPATGEGLAVSTGNAAPTIASTAAIVAPKGFNGQFIWPANGPIISRFGSKGGGKVNDGIELALQEGARFSAAAPGVVAYTGDDVPTLGKLILIDHGAGWVTAYGNASEILVKRGQQVKAGDALGLAGQTGLAERPQLHFELRRDRKPIDPVKKLPQR